MDIMTHRFSDLFQRDVTDLPRPILCQKGRWVDSPFKAHHVGFFRVNASQWHVKPRSFVVVVTFVVVENHRLTKPSNSWHAAAPQDPSWRPASSTARCRRRPRRRSTKGRAGEEATPASGREVLLPVGMRFGECFEFLSRSSTGWLSCPRKESHGPVPPSRKGRVVHRKVASTCF